MVDPILTAEFVARRMDGFRKKGLEIRVNYDFRILKDLKLDGKEVSNMFNPEIFDLDDRKGFWIQGLNKEGETVHIQAMRMDDTGQKKLSDLVVPDLSRAFGADNELSEIDCCEAVKSLSGRVVYHGDMWVHKSLAGKRMGDELGQLALGLAVIEWGPDVVYAFVEDPTHRRGFVLRQGYCHFHPLNQEWKACHPWLHQEDWFAYLNASDLAEMVRADQRKNVSEFQQICPSQIPPGRQPENSELALATG